MNGPRILSVVIPAYNEERTIAAVLERVGAVMLPGWEKEIIVVDDGSRDRTAAEIERFSDQVRLLRHEENRGKGAAIRTGIAAATGDAVIIQDADLEYHPEDWPSMLDAWQKNTGAVIYGSRELHPERRGYPHYVAGVKVLTMINNALFGSRLTDIYTCYKLFPRALIQSVPLASNGFEIEAEVTARLLRQGVAICEVPIRYTPRTFREGKKIRFRDGIIGIRTLVAHRFFI